MRKMRGIDELYDRDRRIFELLKFDFLRRLEDACSHCPYYECKKHALKFTMRKRWREFNITDHRHCLRRRWELLRELLSVLRFPQFQKWSHEPCEKCGMKMFWRDMHLHSETEKKITVPKGKPKLAGRRLEIFRLCPKCSRSYVRSKKPLHVGFERS